MAISLLDSFIEKSNRASDVFELLALFERAVDRLGYDSFALVDYEDPGLPGMPPRPSLLRVTYPQGWVDRYLACGYMDVDPILTTAGKAVRPYAWSELRNLSAQERRVMREAAEFGLLKGAAVPVHGPGTSFMVASIATSSREVEPRQDLGRLQGLVAQFRLVYCRLLGRPIFTSPATLTRRERECLHWSGAGKTSWDTSMILSISERTVNFHLRNAITKLGASNRVEAVVRAIRLGLLQP